MEIVLEVSGTQSARLRLGFSISRRWQVTERFPVYEVEPTQVVKVVHE